MNRRRLLLTAAMVLILIVVAVPVAVGFYYRNADVKFGMQEDEGIAVPSGQTIRFQEVIHGQQGVSGLTMRFRFIAPEIGDEQGELKFEDVEGDMKYLCDAYALPRISALGPKPSQVVISLSEMAVEFGATDANVTQYFEAYGIVDGACVWEVF